MPTIQEEIQKSLQQALLQESLQQAVSEDKNAVSPSEIQQSLQQAIKETSQQEFKPLSQELPFLSKSPMQTTLSDVYGAPQYDFEKAKKTIKQEKARLKFEENVGWKGYPIAIGIGISKGTLPGLMKLDNSMPEYMEKAFGPEGKFGPITTAAEWGTRVVKYLSFYDAFASTGPALQAYSLKQGATPMISELIGRSAPRAMAWGSISFLDNLSKVASGMQKPGFGNLMFEPLLNSMVGGAIGAGYAMPTPLQGAALASGAVALKESLPILADLWTGREIEWQKYALNIGTSALFTAVVEALGHGIMQQAWEGEKAQWAKNKLTEHIMSHSMKYQNMIFHTRDGMPSEPYQPWATLDLTNKDNASKIADLLVSNWGRLGGQTMREAAEPIIQTMKVLPQETQTNIVDNVIKDVKGGIEPISAITEAVEKLSGKPRPEVPKETPVHKRLRSKGKKYEQLLKQEYGVTDDTIKMLKGNKSFAIGQKYSMTDDEAQKAADALKGLYDQERTAIERLAGVDEDRLTIEELDKVLKRTADIRKREQSRFAHIYDRYGKIPVTPTDVPEDVKHLVDKDTGLLPRFRPFENVVARNSIAYIAYTRTLDALADRDQFMLAKKQEYIRKAKKLGLKKDNFIKLGKIADMYADRARGVNLAAKIPMMTQAEVDFFEFGRKEFDDYFEKDPEMFKGKQEAYSPWMRPIDMETEEQLIRELDIKKKVPDHIWQSIEAEKTFRMQNKEMDFLNRLMMYTTRWSKKHFLGPVVKDIRENIMPDLPADMGLKLEDWMFRQLSYIEPRDQALGQIFTDFINSHMPNSISDRFGKLSNRDALRMTQFFIDLVYTSTMGLNPKSALSRLTGIVNTASDLNPYYTTLGLMNYLAQGTRILDKYQLRTDYLPEIYAEYGGKTDMAKFRDFMLLFFRGMDTGMRAWTAHGAEIKFNDNWGKAISHEKPVVKARIKGLMLKGDKDGARKTFIREVVKNTQFFYGKKYSPLITKSMEGKVLLQFSQFPINQAELMGKWWSNKDWGALLTMGMIVAGMGYASKKLGWDYLMRRVGFGPFATEWQLRQKVVPPLLTPLADLGWAVVEPTYYALNYMDDDKAKKAFQRRMKKFGKDLTMFVPGYSMMKQVYGLNVPFVFLQQRGKPKSTVAMPLIPQKGLIKPVPIKRR